MYGNGARLLGHIPTLLLVLLPFLLLPLLLLPLLRFLFLPPPLPPPPALTLPLAPLCLPPLRLLGGLLHLLALLLVSLLPLCLLPSLLLSFLLLLTATTALQVVTCSRPPGVITAAAARRPNRPLRTKRGMMPLLPAELHLSFELLLHPAQLRLSLCLQQGLHFAAAGSLHRRRPPHSQHSLRLRWRRLRPCCYSIPKQIGLL